MSDELGRALRTDRPYHVIPHGIDTDLFQPRDPVAARSALGFEGEHPRVLFAADPALAVKRIALARSAMDLVRRELPDAELLVMHGRDQADVVQAMSACQALVLTSRHEGGPNVIKEAMACNLPVVSTRVGDVEEVLAGSPGNWLVEPQPAAVATGLLRALAHGRTDSRKRIVERYSLSESARRISALYESVA
jgi:glycosyltransferase involved in cell wall biosynthesis